MLDVVNYILGLGAVIFLPLVMIILGLAMGMKLKKAIAAIAWAWPYALILFPVQIGINLLMLAMKWTNCLNVDLWNVWGKIFIAAMVMGLTGSLVFGLIAAGIQIVFELINGDLIQKQLYRICKIPGVTCTHPMMLQAPLLALINRALDFVPGLNAVNMNAADMRKKLGLFGENSVMGFLIGALIAVMGGYDLKGVLTTAVQVATSLVLFPWWQSSSCRLSRRSLMRQVLL